MTGAVDPYAPPQADLATAPRSDASRAKVLAAAEGQRYASLLIVVSMLFVGISSGAKASALLMLPLQLGYLVLMAIVIYRAMRALSSTTVAVIMALLSWVPLVNLVFLVMISSRATKLLRANGFKVGLLGADVAAVRRWAQAER